MAEINYDASNRSNFRFPVAQRDKTFSSAKFNGGITGVIEQNTDKPSFTVTIPFTGGGKQARMFRGEEFELVDNPSSDNLTIKNRFTGQVETMVPNKPAGGGLFRTKEKDGTITESTQGSMEPSKIQQLTAGQPPVWSSGINELAE